MLTIIFDAWSYLPKAVHRMTQREMFGTMLIMGVIFPVWILQATVSMIIQLVIRKKTQDWAKLGTVIQAVNQGTPDQVSAALGTQKPTVLGPGKVTLLMAAAENNPNPDMVRWLISQGLDINAQDQEGMTALHHAVFNTTLDPAFVLLEAGARKDILDKDKMPASAYALGLRGDPRYPEFMKLFDEPQGEKK